MARRGKGAEIAQMIQLIVLVLKGLVYYTILQLRMSVKSLSVCLYVCVYVSVYVC